MGKHTHAAWLWPDRVIGKRRSRELREEHNRLVNAHVDLHTLLEQMREALKGTQKIVNCHLPNHAGIQKPIAAAVKAALDAYDKHKKGPKHEA